MVKLPACSLTGEAETFSTGAPTKAIQFEYNSPWQGKGRKACCSQEDEAVGRSRCVHSQEAEMNVTLLGFLLSFPSGPPYHGMVLLTFREGNTS